MKNKNYFAIPNTLDPINFILKSEIKEGIDYIITSSKIIDFFDDIYKGIKIVRPAFLLPDLIKRVEINLKTVKNKSLIFNFNFISFYYFFIKL